MGAERALAPGEALHDRGNRDYRRIAGENGIAAYVAFDLGKELLLQRQILGHRLDHVVGVAHRFGERGARPYAGDRALTFAEFAQVGGDA
jgi:hypothetical protein